MDKRQFLKRLGVVTAGVAALPAGAVVFQAHSVIVDEVKYCGPGPQTLNAAGTLLLLATAEHGADGLRQALAALAQQASSGCAVQTGSRATEYKEAFKSASLTPSQARALEKAGA
jgi:hypothetical protein